MTNSKVQGRVTLQLHDATTGELQHEESHDNMVCIRGTSNMANIPHPSASGSGLFGGCTMFDGWGKSENPGHHCDSMQISTKQMFPMRNYNNINLAGIWITPAGGAVAPGYSADGWTLLSAGNPRIYGVGYNFPVPGADREIWSIRMTGREYYNDLLNGTTFNDGYPLSMIGLPTPCTQLSNQVLTIIYRFEIYSPVTTGLVTDPGKGVYALQDATSYDNRDVQIYSSTLQTNIDIKVGNIEFNPHMDCNKLYNVFGWHSLRGETVGSFSQWPWRTKFARNPGTGSDIGEWVNGTLFGDLAATHRASFYSSYLPDDFVTNSPGQVVHNHSIDATYPFQNTNTLAGAAGQLTLDTTNFVDTEMLRWAQARVVQTGRIDETAGYTKPSYTVAEQGRFGFYGDMTGRPIDLPWYIGANNAIASADAGEMRAKVSHYGFAHVEEYPHDANNPHVVTWDDQGVTIHSFLNGWYRSFYPVADTDKGHVAINFSDINQCCVDKHGNIWVADNTIGLVRIADPLGTPVVTTMTTGTNLIPGTQCYAVSPAYEDANGGQGAIIAVFEGGVSISVNPNNATPTFTTQTATIAGSIDAWANVRGIRCDREDSTYLSMIIYHKPTDEATSKGFKAWWATDQDVTEIDGQTYVLTGDGSKFYSKACRVSRYGSSWVTNHGNVGFHMYKPRGTAAVRLRNSNSASSTTISAGVTFLYDNYNEPYSLIPGTAPMADEVNGGFAGLDFSPYFLCNRVGDLAGLTAGYDSGPGGNQNSEAMFKRSDWTNEFDPFGLFSILSTDISTYGQQYYFRDVSPLFTFEEDTQHRTYGWVGAGFRRLKRYSSTDAPYHQLMRLVNYKQGDSRSHDRRECQHGQWTPLTETAFKTMNWNPNTTQFEKGYHEPAANFTPNTATSGTTGVRKNFDSESHDFTGRSMIDASAIVQGNTTDKLTFTATITPADYDSFQQYCYGYATQATMSGIRDGERFDTNERQTLFGIRSPANGKSITIEWNTVAGNGHTKTPSRTTANTYDQLGIFDGTNADNTLGTVKAIAAAPANAATYRIAAVVDMAAGNVAFYVDGVLQGTAVVLDDGTNFLNDANLELYIGSNGYAHNRAGGGYGGEFGIPSAFYRGTMSDVEVWNVGFTQATVNEDFADYQGVTLPTNTSVTPANDLLVHFKLTDTDQDLKYLESKQMHTASEAVNINGLNLQFADAAGAVSSFNATDHYTWGLGKGILKDNVTSYNWTHPGIYRSRTDPAFDHIESSVLEADLDAALPGGAVTGPATPTTSAVLFDNAGLVRDNWMVNTNSYYLQGDQIIPAEAATSATGTASYIWSPSGKPMNMVGQIGSQVTAYRSPSMGLYDSVGSTYMARVYANVNTADHILDIGGSLLTIQCTPGDYIEIIATGSGSFTINHRDKDNYATILNTHSGTNTVTALEPYCSNGTPTNWFTNIKVDWWREGFMFDIGNRVTGTGKWERYYRTTDNFDGVLPIVKIDGVDAVVKVNTTDMQEYITDRITNGWGPGIGECVHMSVLGILVFNPADVGKTITVNAAVVYE